MRKNSVMGGTETPDSSLQEFNIRKDKSLYQVRPRPTPTILTPEPGTRKRIHTEYLL